MSDERGKTIHGKSISAMDTASLKLLLEQETAPDRTPDFRRVDEILDLLAERNGQPEPNTEEAWADFCQNHLTTLPMFPSEPPEADIVPIQAAPKRKARLRRVFTAAIAAALLLAVGGITVAAGESGFWRVVAHWSEDTFGYTLQHDEEETHTRSAELEPLWALVEDSGAQNSLLPNYLPEGYVQEELKYYDDTDTCFASYVSDDSSISISIAPLHDSGAMVVEKDSSEPELQVINGVEYYIMTNNGTPLAAWTNGSYVYCIGGAVRKTLLEMIESVGWEVN